jgi:hypothetical protein
MKDLGELIKEIKVQLCADDIYGLKKEGFDETMIEAVKRYSKQPYRAPSISFSFIYTVKTKKDADDLEDWYTRHHG